jgi:hypothetical protein
MPQFKVIFVKQPELPLFTKKLRVNKIELFVQSKSFKSAIRTAKAKNAKRNIKGFELLGVIKVNNE